jgi:hypothetical protein
MMCPRIILVDLPEHGRGVFVRSYSQAKPAPSDLRPYLVRKGELRSRKNTDGRRRIFRRGEPSCARVEVMSFELVGNPGWTRLNIVLAVIAHVAPRELPLARKTPRIGVSSDWMGFG